jgi:DNA gyrase/topoisomerase IV subunit A
MNEEVTLISPDKIDEWIREIEERPISAELIIRYIANRLSELSSRDEELVAQNIELLSGRKVEEYESRIASLEYQLDLLKRQLGGEVVLPSDVPVTAPDQKMFNVLLYNPLGQVLCVEMELADLESQQTVARLIGEVSPQGMPVMVLATNAQEELLFIFDTGRTVRRPVTQLPAIEIDQLGWDQAFIEEPRIKEELAAIQPIGSMPLYDTCIQASRRGYVKKMKTSFFTSHLEEDYIGSGVKLRADKTCGLAFADGDDLFVMVSQEGFIFSMQVDQLPAAIEEVIQLGVTDHIVSTFVMGQKPSVLFITQDGKAVHRQVGWLDRANSFKSKGQSILSKERRQRGTRIVAAAPVDEADWGVFLQADGTLITYKLENLLATGSITPNQAEAQVLSFSVFSVPDEDVE